MNTLNTLNTLERKKQLIAQGALHRAALYAERRATADALQPEALARGLLQRAAIFGTSLLASKGNAGAAIADVVSSALPTSLPAALPLIFEGVSLLTRFGRQASRTLGRKTLLRGALVATAAAAVTFVIRQRKRSISAASQG